LIWPRIAWGWFFQAATTAIFLVHHGQLRHHTDICITTSPCIASAYEPSRTYCALSSATYLASCARWEEEEKEGEEEEWIIW
jgi:hypothetical protein